MSESNDNQVCEQPQLAPNSILSQMPKQTTFRILVVDDHVFNIFSLRAILNELNFTSIDEAIDG